MSADGQTASLYGALIDDYDRDDTMTSPRTGSGGEYPGTPRWVKVFGVVIAVAVLLLVILMLTRGPGGHGPGRHLPLGDTDHSAPNAEVDGETPSLDDQGRASGTCER